MLRLLKRAARRLLANDHFPLIRDWYFERDASRRIAAYEAHSRMSYTEIESAISTQYEKMFGRTLNWDNPQTYNEKIHVSKVYMPTPLKTRLADKYLVRDWICEKIGDEYLIPLLGAYDSFDEIDFDSLPDKFVIKCNHDSGSVTLVSDKSKLDMRQLKRRYDLYMKLNFAWMGWEMHYRDIKPKILIEQYIKQLDGGLIDYKVHCFNGKPEFIQVIGDRNLRKHTGFQRNYDFEWHKLNWILEDYPEFTRELDRPVCLEEIYKYAEILCRDFDYVRVDFYAIEDTVLFGEMTFSPANGSYRYKGTWTEELDYKLGSLWPFDNEARKRVLAQRSRP